MCRVRYFLAGLLTTAAMLLAGCGGGSSPESSPPTPQSAVVSGSIATFPNARATYALTRSVSGYTVSDHGDGTQTAIPATVHSLVFADVTLNLNIAAKSATIAAADLKLLIELYVAFFNRVPDADGLGFWIDQFKQGQSIDSIADDFYSAAIYYSSITGYSAAMTNAEFVRIIYKNVLGRSGATAPPDEDVAFWSGQLTSGNATRGSLIRVMLGSAHTFLGDVTWGWVAQLLDNKYLTGRYVAVTRGLNYNSPSESISQGMAIAGAVTSSDIAAAIAIVNTAAGLTNVRYAIPAALTLIPTETYSIPANPYMQPFESAWQIPKNIDFADFNGDDLLDMVLVPGFAQHLPVLPVQIWLNKGDGSFRNGTAEVFVGPPPLIWNPTQLLVGDFNGDGRSDVFFINSGPEFEGTNYENSLILSRPDGKYMDATARIPNNAPAFNHQGGMGDANGDGHLDVVLNAQPGNFGRTRGIKLFFGDGTGGFNDATSRLPIEIRWMPDNERPGDLVQPLFDFQDPGCQTFADVDGDGKAEVVSGSYSRPDRNDRGGTRTVRIHKLGADGNYTEVARVPIPAAIADIPFGYEPPPPFFAGLGCSQIVPGDFHGSGRNDLLVQWEGNGKYYVQFLRNDGNLQFTDVTLEAFGSYNETFFTLGGAVRMGPGHYRVIDINADGKLDLVGQLGGTSADNIVSHVAWVNDGTGRFTRWTPQGPNGPLSPSDLLSAAKCGSCGFIPLMFDTNRSGIASLVLMDFQSLQTNGSPSQTTGVYLSNFVPVGMK